MLYLIIHHGFPHTLSALVRFPPGHYFGAFQFGLFSGSHPVEDALVVALTPVQRVHPLTINTVVDGYGISGKSQLGSAVNGTQGLQNGSRCHIAALRGYMILSGEQAAAQTQA